MGINLKKKLNCLTKTVENRQTYSRKSKNSQNLLIYNKKQNLVTKQSSVITACSRNLNCKHLIPMNLVMLI